MMDWQPIETAPKECPVILTDGNEVEVGEGSRYSDGRWYASTGLSLVWEGSEDRGGLRDVGFIPTHWMPLPQSPA